MTREQLFEIRDTYKEVWQLQDSIARLESMRISPRTAAYGDSGSHSQSKGDIQPTLIAQMDGLLHLYNIKLKRCVTLTTMFERALERCNSRERRVMRLYYIDGMTWEQVAEETHYSDRQVYRTRKRAFRKICELKKSS